MNEAQLLDLANVRISQLECDVFYWKTATALWERYAIDMATTNLQAVVKLEDKLKGFPTHALTDQKQAVGMRTI